MASKRLAIFSGIVLACMLTVAQGQPQTSTTASSLPVLATNTPCRFKPKSDTCGLPLFLANFQVRGIRRIGSREFFFVGSALCILISFTALK
jgi:hypothetical protein